MLRTTLATIATLATLGLAVRPAFAGPFTFSYGGRLADAGDKAIAGPVDLELKFYRTAAGGAPLGVSPMTFPNVTLSDGVFQVDLTQLTPEEMHLVFDPSGDTFVEVTDRTHGTTYPRQRMTAIPFALKVPVDGKTLGYDVHGNLTVPTPGGPGTNQFLTKDASGNWAWGTPSGGGGGGGLTVGMAANNVVALDATAKLPSLDGSQLTQVNAARLQGRPISSVTPTLGQVLSWTGTDWAPASNITLTAGSPHTLGIAATSGTAGSDLTVSGGDAAGADLHGGNLNLNGGAGTGNIAGGNIIFNTGGSGSSGSTPNAPTPKMTITASGSVGIGTTNPNGNLHIYNNATQARLTVETGGTGTSAPQLNLADSRSGGSIFSLASDLGKFKITDASNGPRLVIDSGGNVGIGSISPSRTLDVSGQVKVSGIGPVISAQSSSASPSNEVLSLLNNSGTSILSAQNSGKIGIGSTNPGATLDVNGDARIAGALYLGVVTPSGTAYSVGTHDTIILATPSSPSMTLTMPTCDGTQKGRVVYAVNRGTYSLSFAGPGTSGLSSVAVGNSTKAVCDGTTAWVAF